MNDAADQHDQEQPGETPSSSGTRNRRALRITVVSLLVLSLLGLFLSYAPGFVVRYLVESELDALGIDHAGIETIRINPWTRELWLGPVRFGVGVSDKGQVGELGLRLKFGPLFDRRVSIEHLLVRGIDVVVRRDTRQAVSLNGIALAELTTSPGEPGPEVEETDKDGWKAGIDRIEIHDSRLIFEDRGSLELEVERLALMDFNTWEPDSPGRFELVAGVNNIKLNWTGEARPFADNITLDITSRTSQAEIPKVLRFTGPLGLELERQEGTYDVQLQYTMTLFDSGRVEGSSKGTIDIRGADYRRSDGAELKMDKAKLDLDLNYQLGEAGDVHVQGRVDADVGRHHGSTGDTSLGGEAGRISLAALDAALDQDGSLRISVRPEIELQAAEFSGPIEISVEAVLEGLAKLQSLSAPGESSVADTGLGDYTGKTVVVPSSDVRVERLKTRGESLQLHSVGGAVELGITSSSELSNVGITVGERRIGIERLQNRLEKLKLSAGQGQMVLDMAARNSLVSANSRSPLGELKLGALETGVEGLQLQTRTGEVSLQLAAGGKASGLSVQLYSEGMRPEIQLHLTGANAHLDQASLDAAQGGLRWQAAGNAALDGLSADFAKGEEGSLKFTRARIESMQADEKLQISADAFNIDGMNLYLKRSLIEALAGRGQAAGSAPPQAEGEVSAPAPKQAAEAPVPGHTAAGPVDLSRVQSLLTRHGYAPGPIDGRMGQRTAAAISAFQRREGLVVDGRASAALLAALEGKTAGSRKRPAREGPAGPGIRLGQLALTGKPVIRFRDDLVQPEVKVDAVFEEAWVRNLDTRGGQEKTEVRVVADINEFTNVELSGWVKGVDSNAELDLNAKVENLELSTYSPYVAPLSGVHLESGRLDTTTAGKTQAGGLQGEILVDLEGIAFQPLSKTDAERLAGNMGVPLDTAVGLLQDDDGHIRLALPLGGSLAEPDVDISSAVNKAISGALKKVFPPTLAASLLSGVSKGAAPALDPIFFQPGSGVLDETGQGYADKLVALLVEHPKLILRVCGRATTADRQQARDTTSAAKKDGEKSPTPGKKTDTAKLEQGLSELAQERARAVRRYLIKDKGSNAKQVSECRSTFDAADQERPRVEILL